MRIKMKRFLGILLTLTLVLGLMPGMGLTAYAATAYRSGRVRISDVEVNDIISKDCELYKNVNYALEIYDTDGTTLLESYGSSGFISNVQPGYNTIVIQRRGGMGSTVKIKKLSPDPEITNVSLDQSSLSLTAGGETATLTASVTANYDTVKTVNWSSSDTSVATVNNGVITPVGAGGPVTIKATSTWDNTKYAECVVTVNASHTHSFTYAADGATITATCTAEGCDLPESSAGAGDHVATLTISANGGTYDGTTAYGATITDANSIQGDAKVQYQKKTDGSYGTATETAPTDAGEYKASITVGGATASVEYTIAQADPTATAPTGLTATYGQTLADVSLEGKNPEGNTPGTWAWADSTQSVGNVVTPAATFKATFTPDSSNYKTVENVDVTVTVGKADPTAPTGLTATYGQTLANVTLPDGWTWADSTQSVGGVVSPAATFKANFTGNDNYNAASNVDVTVTVSKADQTAPTGLTATKASSNSAADGKISGVTSAMEYQIDVASAWTAVGENKTEITDLAAGTYKVRYAETVNENASPEATIQVGVKEDQTAPTGLTATKASSSTATDGKISGVTSAMEYQIDGASTWTAVGENQTEITGLTTGTYKVRYAGTADKNASPETTVTIGVKEDQTAPTGLTATKASSSTATDGKISGVNDDMEYQIDGATTWTTVGAGKTVITGLTAGTYKVRFAGTADKNASPEATITIGVKENQTAPTGLTATKASSSTATDGKISGVTSAMEYQKSGDSAWTSVENNKTEITGLTAGTYKVRYAGTADKNASPETTVTIGVKENQTVPTGLTATKASSSTATDGKISGVNDDMEYQIDGASTWITVGAGKTEITGLTSGTYKVRYVGTADKNASPAVTVEVGVKVAPIVTAPTAKTLTYDGSVQALVNAGITTGGTMNYAVSTNSATAPSTGWSASIPTATDARTYYVWYKVKGDKDHLDSEPACVEAAIAKRNVTLTSAEDSKDYDGKPLTNNNITVTGDGWAEGEGATYNVTGTQILPGASDNGFTYTLNNNTKEHNYNISKVINKLTVNDRTEKYEINVEVNSDNVTYDGNEHEVSGFKTLEFLCDDVTYTVSGLSASVIGTDAGTYDVVVTGTPLVKNSDDKDLTKQFIVNIVPGQLVIDTRNVSFTSASETKQYDGEPLTNDNVEITGDGFAEGEGASFDVTGNQLVVGSSANTFTYTLNEGTNPDNYSITSQEGTLTVTNRLAKYEIIPKANSGEFTYDGSEHSVTGFVTDTFEVATDDETTHIYTLSGLTAEGTGIDVGEYTVNITGTPVVIDAEGNDVSSEFSVTPVAGNIVINKRNVTLTSASDSKAYDGKELTNEEVIVSGDGWAEGEGAEYKVTGTRKLPGETRNSFTYTLNEGTNADNYEITSVEGTLTITDRKAEDEEGSDKDVRYEITVVANSGNFTYDGTEHEVSGVESTEFTINDVTYTVSGLEASAKGTEVGTYPVKISGTPVVTDADGNDLTKQFTVNTKEGTLTVVEKSVNPEGDIRYSNYSGDRVVWTKGSNAGCEFVFKRSVDDELTFGHFTGIDVESKAVDASNYTAVSGSVVITLKPEYLETLAVGDHLLTANFDDGNSVTVKFTIKEKSEEKKSDTTLNNKKADVTPETGDTVNVQLIFLVMVLSMCVIFALCNLRSKLDEKKRRR